MGKKHLFVLPFAVAGLVLAGCSSNSGSSTTTVTETAPPSPPTTVTETVTPPVMFPTETFKPLVPPVDTCVEGNVDPSSWNAADDVNVAEPSVAQIFDIRPGRHECFDQVTFDVEAPGDVSFSVGYADDDVKGQGSGLPVSVAGGAALNVVITAAVPVPDLFVGYDYSADWPALKQVKYLSSFEGQTQFAVGVDHRTGFAVETWRHDDVTSVILYIAHE